MTERLEQSDFFVKKVFTKYLNASIFGLLATTITGLIDTAMIGLFLGSDGLSAMSLVNYVYLIYYTVGAIVGMGGATAANFHIGRNNLSEYRKVFSLSFWLLLGLSVVVTIIGFLVIEPLTLSFNAGPVVRENAKAYLGPYIAGGVFTLMIYIPLNFLKVEGFPQITSGLFILSSFLNAALTALFLSPICNMGMAGASLGTVLAMALTCLIGFYLLFKKGKNAKLTSSVFEWKRLRSLLVAGSPNGLNNLFSAGKVIVLNAIIIQIGASFALPCLAITKSISDVVFSIISGVALAMVPIAGVFFGEKDNAGIRSVFKKVVKTAFWISIFVGLLLFFFPQLVCSIFKLEDPALIEQCYNALRCLAVGIVFCSFNISYTWLFNSIRKSWFADLILALRLFGFAFLSALLLSKAWGLHGLWLSAVVAEVLTIIVILVVIALIRKKNPSLDRFLLDTSGEGVGEKTFSVRNDLDDIMNASNAVTEVCEQFDVPMKKASMASLVLEEMLTVIITYCMDNSTESFIDIRVKLLGPDILIRIRNTGKIFDPLSFYEIHKEDPEYFERILGLKLIIKSAKVIEFQETFGVNNLMVIF